MLRAIVVGVSCMLLVGCGGAGGDEDDLLPTDAPPLGVEGDGFAWDGSTAQIDAHWRPEVDYIPAWDPGTGHIVPNCGVCVYDLTSSVLHSLPPELFKHLAPQTKLILSLTLKDGDPGIMFDWDSSATVSQHVEFPRRLSFSPLVSRAYLVIPGNSYSIEVPIIRGAKTDLELAAGEHISSFNELKWSHRAALDQQSGK